MARKRFVSPEFFAHGDLYDAERATGLPLRLAYAGLWTVTDRRGMFWWKPREMKLQIMPYDDVDFERILTALEAYGFVERYAVDGKRFGRVPSFERWQTFHRNESPSDVPDAAPELRQPSTIGLEPSNGRPEPSPSVAVAVATTAAVATTVPTVAPKRANARSAREGVSKFPHFRVELCDAAYEAWQSSAGAVVYSRFRNAFGPLFTGPESERPAAYPRDDELVPAVKLYLAASLGTREASFRSPERCAGALSGMVDVLRTTSDAVQRIDRAQVHLGLFQKGKTAAA